MVWAVVCWGTKYLDKPTYALVMRYSVPIDAVFMLPYSSILSKVGQVKKRVTESSNKNSSALNIVICVS